MKISISAMMNFGASGADAIVKKTQQIRDNLATAGKTSANLGRLPYKDKGLSTTSNRTMRGAAANRSASGRDFSGLAAGLQDNDNDTNNLVAAYATLAANLFAVTAAFTALQKAAQTEQLAKGLELMGARSGIALGKVARDLQSITDHAISYADAMKVVAQGTAAGLNIDEMERIGKVARGASVALGRDMGDAMDRLTRGVIKLEPELLDELGIMVRLDEASRIYAQANNKTVSNLTQVEKRQAFLNAVLAEGESKFADVSEQISANPYDKLAASVKDLGTGFLNLTNAAVKPLIDILTMFPTLALIPMMGIFKEAAGKILPDMGKAMDKVGQKTARLRLNLDAVSQAQSGAIGEFEGMGKLMVGNPLERLGMSDPQTSADLFDIRNKNILLEREDMRSKILTRINKLKQQGLAANEEEIKDLEAVNVELRESARQISTLRRGQSIENNLISKIGVEEARNVKLAAVQDLQIRGAYLSSVGLSFKLLGGDLAGLVTGTENLSTRLHKVGTGFATVGTAIGSAFNAALGVFALVAAAIQIGLALIEHFKTKERKAFEVSKKELKELGEGAEKTRQQIEKMFEPGRGQRGLGLDAAITALEGLIEKGREFIELKKEMQFADAKLAANLANPQAFNALVLSEAFSGNGSSKAYVENLSEEAKFKSQIAKFNDSSKKALTETLELVKLIDKDGYQELLVSLNSRKRTEAEIYEIIDTQGSQIIATTGKYKALQDSAKGFSDAMKKAIPKDLNSPLVETASHLEEMAENTTNLRDLGGIGEQLNLSKEDLDRLGRLSAAYGQDITGSINTMTAALDKYKVQQVLVNQIVNDGGKNSAEWIEGLVTLGKLAIEVGQVWLKLKGDLAKGVGAAAKAEQKNTVLLSSLADLQKINSLEKNIRDSVRETTKERRLANMEIAKAGTSFGANDKFFSGASDLITKKESLAIAKEEAVIQKQFLQREYNAQYTKAKADEATQNLDSVGRAQATAKLTTLSSIYRLEKKLIDEKVSNSAAEIANEEEILALYSSKAAISERQLTADQVALDLRKEIFNIDQEIAKERLAISNIRQDMEARRTGIAISPQQERQRQIDNLNLELDSMKTKKEFLEAESNIKIEQAALQMTIIEEQYKLLAAQYRKDGNDAGADALTNGPLKDLQDISSRAEQGIRDVLASNISAVSTTGERLKLEIDALAGSSIDYIFDAFKAKLVESNDKFNLSKESMFLPGASKGIFEKAVEDEGGLNAIGANEDQLKGMKLKSLEIAEVQTAMEGLNRVSSAFTDGMSTAFTGIIDGSKSAKQAFGDLAIGVLQAIAQMLIEMLALKIASAFLGAPAAGAGGTAGAGGAVPAGAAGGIIPLAQGGITARGLQGVVKRPTYLVGEGRYNEAVVPLPNGRSIPVQMHGGSSQSNNVAVNVNIASNGNTQTESQGQEDMGKLGEMLAQAVQKELLAQKAPGGILNKYGAS